MDKTECCMCLEKGNFPNLKELSEENIYQLNELKSPNQAKLLLEMGFKETDCFCSECFWK